MGFPHRALLLPAAERRLLVEAGLAVAAVRIALWILPYRWVHRWGERPAGTARRPEVDISIESLARATRRASRFVPRASCLTQAIAARLLLARYGLKSRLCIGVARAESGAPVAHAWLEREGRVVVGALPDLARFSRLPIAGEKVK